MSGRNIIRRNVRRAMNEVCTLLPSRYSTSSSPLAGYLQGEFDDRRW